MTAPETTRAGTTRAETTTADVANAETANADAETADTTTAGTAAGRAAPPSGDPAADDHRLVHQLVFRRDPDHPSGDTGLALAAWSYAPERAEKILRVAARLRLTGPDAAPGLVRIVSQRSERVLLVRRVPRPGPGGRPDTVCHVLFGTDGSLAAGTCLGLHRWDWPGGDLPLHDVRGDLAPVPADALLTSAALGLDALSAALPQAAVPLSAAVAAVLRDPGGRHSFLDSRGGDLPYLVLRGLHGVFGRLRAQQPFGWSFATHDTDDSERHQFVFVLRRPAEALHDVDRVRTDLERPRDDRVLATATALVRLHVETAGQGDGDAASPVAVALEQETGGIDDLRAAGDDLLRAAERVVRSFDSRVLPVTSGLTATPAAGAEPAAAGAEPPVGPAEDSPAVFRNSTDDYLLYALRDDLTEARTDLLLREIRRRLPRWPLALRAELGVLALDKLLAGSGAPAGHRCPPPPPEPDGAADASPDAVPDAAPDADISPPHETPSPAGPGGGDSPAGSGGGDDQARIVAGCAGAAVLILTVLGLLVRALWQG